MLFFANPAQLKLATQGVCDRWRSIEESGKDIMHFAHSEGAILTDPCLWRFRITEPTLFAMRDFFGFENEAAQEKRRMHVVLYGYGYAFLFDHKILPEDTHFVITAWDFVGNVPGGHFPHAVIDAVAWIIGDNEANILKQLPHRQKTVIVDYSGTKFLPGFLGDDPGESQHTFRPKLDLPNTYGWWTYWCGGGAFLEDIGGRSIDGDKYALQKNQLKWSNEAAFCRTTEETDSWMSDDVSDPKLRNPWVTAYRAIADKDQLASHPENHLEFEFRNPSAAIPDTAFFDP
jgi:hypothetical protein